jgi:SAM-dependent methyltransferase/3-polyprenyl-4-hydroxybenzoate decarboxylase
MATGAVPAPVWFDSSSAAGPAASTTALKKMSGDSAERWVRAASLRAFDCKDAVTVLGRDGALREFRGESALLVRELLRALRGPKTFAEVLAHLETVAAGVSEARGAVEQALAVLREAGAVTPAPPPTKKLRLAPQGKLVLGVSGAISAAHTPALAEKLLARGFQVRVALTQAARRFVTADALRALTHRRVHQSLFTQSARHPAPHIALAQWADVVLVAPATATTVARIAAGDCSELVAAVALSTRAPVVVAPSMNGAMLEAAPIARNMSQLVEDGFYVVHGAMAREVADAPESRRLQFGSWPVLDDLVAVVEHVHTRRRQRQDEASASPEAWERAYRDTPAVELPFHTERLDEDLRHVLEGIPRPATLWDLGAGLGTVARESAKLGFAVTGSDVSARAMALAQERASGIPVDWRVDDVRRSEVPGAFDVVVDRGCLHTLDVAGARAYARAVAQRTHAGSLLVLKVHRVDEPGDWHTLRYGLADLEALFSPAFELQRWSRSTLPAEGRTLPARAWLAVFERQATALPASAG